MPVIFTQPFKEDKETITSVVYMPEYLSEGEKAQGIEVVSVPEAESQTGKASLMFYRPSTGEIFYEYVDRQLTQEELYQDLQKRQELMQKALDELIFGGGL